MLGWLRRKKIANYHQRYGEDWITVPFRYVEAARVSIYTIGSQPELPPAIKWWIAQWLVAYNSRLVYYMRENYGPDIFPILDSITQDVMAKDGEQENSDTEDSWEKWESQFREET